MEKVITFLDFETTGANTKTDRIVQLYIVRENLNGSKDCISTIVNPGIPIAPEAEAVHGISNTVAQTYGPLKEIAQDIYELVSDTDIICGYNSNRFDVPILVNELARCGIAWDWTKVKLLDVKNLYTRLTPRTLEAAYKDLVNEAGFEGAHDAGADVHATRDILAAMRDMGIPDDNQEAQTSLEALCELSTFGKVVDLDGKFGLDKDGDIIFNFGKHYGKKAQNHTDFLMWMLDKDFSQDTLRVARSFFVKKEG